MIGAEQAVDRLEGYPLGPGRQRDLLARIEAAQALAVRADLARLGMGPYAHVDPDLLAEVPFLMAGVLEGARRLLELAVR